MTGTVVRLASRNFFRRFTEVSYTLMELGEEKDKAKTLFIFDLGKNLYIRFSKPNLQVSKFFFLGVRNPPGARSLYLRRHPFISMLTSSLYLI